MAEHKNVVLMIADDLGRDYLSCYGNKSIKTPHLDQLAASGTRFTNAFASTASCSGSRSTIYTGLHTHQNGQYGLQHSWNAFTTFDHIDTAPKLFGRLGYLTGIIGKVHVGTRQAYPWEIFESSESRNVKWVAERAAAFFEHAKEDERPFHLTIGFTDPHRDETRGGFANDFKEVLDAGLDREVPDYEPSEVEVKSFMTDVQELRTELVQYYKSISRMDLGVGLILEALKEKGLDDSTLIVFISDNGAPFINSKTTLYDAGVQLPFVLRQPGQRTSIVNPNIVSFLDIVPTTLAWATEDHTTASMEEAASSDSPQRLGNNILPILESTSLLPPSKWKHHVFGSHTFHEVQNYYPTRFIRTHRYKYHRNIAHRLDFPFAADLYGSLSWEGIRNKDGPGPVIIGKRPLDKYLFRAPEELYDLDHDPDEVVNVVGKAEYQGVLEWCRKMVEGWQYQTQDPWLYKDGVSATVMDLYVKQGLRLPDRYELDLKDPGTRNTKAWRPPQPPEELPAGPPDVQASSGMAVAATMWNQLSTWWQDS